MMHVNLDCHQICQWCFGQFTRSVDLVTKVPPQTILVFFDPKDILILARICLCGVSAPPFWLSDTSVQ